MRRLLLLMFFLLTAAPGAAQAADATSASLDTKFSATVKPFLQQYCVSCHGKDKENIEGDLDLLSYSSTAEAARDSIRWDSIIDKLEAAKMPPKKAKLHPADEGRREVLAWFRAARDFQTLSNAGDPGIVLARRLSNAEYDYTIRDLTGVDLHSAKEFPVDPSNTAGFDNSGESLTMSPSLLNKYLQAAHDIANHLVLKPDGFVFSPTLMLAETDRDQYCVQRIVNFYHTQDIDYADYFEAAWRYKNRAALGHPDATIAQIATERKVSAKYLQTIWDTLETDSGEVGPLIKLQAMWKALPAPAKGKADIAREGCEQMREYVVQLRKKVEPRFLNLAPGRVPANAEPMLIWKNVQYATHRMTFDPAQLQVEGEPPPKENNEIESGGFGSFGPGMTQLIHNEKGDPDLVVPAGQRAKYEAAFAHFCRVFPDRFYMQERGLNYFDTTKFRGRLLSAGFHSLLGYFRDDQPLYELILNEKQQKELDDMWRDMDFVANVTKRTYIQFCSSGQRGERGIAQTESQVGARAEDIDVTSTEKIKELEQAYLAKAEGGDPKGIEAIKYWFGWMNDTIRWTEKARVEAEPAQLQALLKFARRAYRHPLSKDDSVDILNYYNSCRQSGLDHESAMREGIVSILMSPDLCYRIELASPSKEIHPLSDYELASRLSYFLWSSIPDEQLLAHAAAGDLHEPQVLVAQTRRMLQDPRVRALASEFGGSWLDFRRFDEIATVDRDRFPQFTNDLRAAMYEEPIRFLVDAFQSNRSMLDLIYANYTFVNPVLAKHYGVPVQGDSSDDWTRIENADQYGRGGILGMAAFMTKNAPGLRTSPVKRGFWVVKNVLGEKINPPPPNVPQLPRDEAKLDLPLRQMLERHRQEPSCAACHARFDSLGLVFEGYGPIGERRDNDLAGRPIDASAAFPDDGGEGSGFAGLRQYIRDHRQKDFTENLSRKMLSYALGRTLILSDQLLLKQINEKLQKDSYHIETLIDGIVTSPQFLNKRGREQVAAAR